MPAAPLLGTETFRPPAIFKNAVPPLRANLSPLPKSSTLIPDVPRRKIKLLKKLRRGVHLADTLLDTGYWIACVAVSLWGILCAAGAAFTGHWGLFSAQAGSSGALLYVVKRRKESLEGVIDNAKDILGHQFLEMDIFDVISEVMQSFAGQGLDIALTGTTAAVAPIALTFPVMVLNFIPVKTWWVTLAVNAGVAAVVAAVAGVGYAIYGPMKEMVLKRVDMVVDAIDDMPMFDFLDSDDDDDDERTPLLV